MNNSDKKIFIDCGTHFGEGLDYFINRLGINETWQVHSFEANPSTYNAFTDKQKYQKLNCSFYNLAVSDKNGKVIFNRETPKNYPEEFMMGGGSSFMSIQEWNPWGTFKENYNNSVDVESFDLSEFVGKIDTNNIFCKMDIEGAEFQVLEKMIVDETILKVKEIWIEFHEEFFNNPNPYRIRKASILKYLSENGISFHEWH
jgi:FkbM family methyltransferase